MAFTLNDAKNLSQSKLTSFVIDEFRKSPLMDTLVFDDTVKPQGGNTLAYVYNRVTTLPTAAGRAIGSEYAPQEAKTTPVTVNLKVFGGSFALDLSTSANIEANWKKFLYEMRQVLKLLDGSPSIMGVNRDMFAVFQTIADFSTQFTQTKTELGTEIVKYGNATIMDMGDTQTVTLYHQEGETYRRTVIQGAYLDFKKNSNTDKVGSHEVNSFLLVLPQGAGGQAYLPPVQYAAAENKCGYYTVATNDKVLLGVGDEITTPEQWRTFIPFRVDGLVVAQYIDVKYWQGEICHLEVGG